MNKDLSKINDVQVFYHSLVSMNKTVLDAMVKKRLIKDHSLNEQAIVLGIMNQIDADNFSKNLSNEYYLNYLIELNERDFKNYTFTEYVLGK